MNPKSDVSVRQATSGDAAMMSLIHKRSWVKAYAGLIEPSFLDGLKDDRWVKSLEKGLSEKTIRAWLACVEGAPVACACVGISHCAGDEDALELISIYCLPEYWRKGAGHALMQSVKEYARAAGYQRIAMWVLEGNNRAIRFYEKEGFLFTGERKRLTIGGKENAEIRYAFAFT